MPRRKARPAIWSTFALPAVLFVTVVYVAVLVVMLIRTFTDPEPGVGNYVDLLTNPGFLRVLGNTLLFSLIAALLAVLIGYPIAYSIARTSGLTRAFLIVAIVTPYLTSVLIRTFAWQVILGTNGPINAVITAVGLPPAEMLYTGGAVVVGLAHSQLPLVVLALLPVIRKVDANQGLAARSLGAGPAVAFVRTFLPATRPAIVVAFVLAFVYCVGSFAVPALLGGNQGRMVGSFIHMSIANQGNYTQAATAAAILAVAVLVVLFVFMAVTRQRLESIVAPELRQGSRTRARRRAARAGRISPPLGEILLVPVARLLDRIGISARTWPLTTISVLFSVLILLPQLMAIPISFAEAKSIVFPPKALSLHWYQAFFTPEWLVPTGVSLRIAVIAAIVATVLGALAAIGVGRARSRWIENSFTPYLLIPLIFPAVVAAGAFYVGFLRVGLNDSELGIVLAHIAITLPQAFVLTLAGVQTLNPDYERAAASLGAGRFRVLQRIVLPLLTGQIVASLGLTFITSFDESTIAVFLSGLRVKTLPRKIYESMSTDVDPTVGVVAVFFMVIAGILGLAWMIFRRRRGRRLTLEGGRA